MLTSCITTLKSFSSHPRSFSICVTQSDVDIHCTVKPWHESGGGCPQASRLTNHTYGDWAHLTIIASELLLRMEVHVYSVALQEDVLVKVTRTDEKARLHLNNVSLHRRGLTLRPKVLSFKWA